MRGRSAPAPPKEFREPTAADHAADHRSGTPAALGSPAANRPPGADIRHARHFRPRRANLHLDFGEQRVHRTPSPIFGDFSRITSSSEQPEPNLGHVAVVPKESIFGKCVSPARTSVCRLKWSDSIFRRKVCAESGMIGTQHIAVDGYVHSHVICAVPAKLKMICQPM